MLIFVPNISAEIIIMAEEAVAAMPLDALEWHQEKYILDYFAEVGIFMKHGMFAWAEVTLRQLIKLRISSPDIGLDHHETRQLQKYLEACLRAQHKHKEANEIAEEVSKAGKSTKNTWIAYNSSRLRISYTPCYI